MSYFPAKTFVNKPSDKAIEFPIESHRELLEVIYDQWAELVQSLGFDSIEDLDMNQFEQILKLIEPEFIDEAYYDNFTRGYIFGLCMAFVNKPLEEESEDE